MNIKPYHKYYRQWASFVAAIKKKKHYYLITKNEKNEPIIKIYEDKDLTKFFAMFRIKYDKFFKKKIYVLKQHRII